jgi:DNA topoisomerase-1
MNLVVVESPAKAKTINKYLGKDYTVLASYGHVRDLPAKDGSVRPDEDFAMSWDIDGKSAKHLNEIAQALKESDRLILATDPDREGEAISWHVLEILKKKGVVKDKPVERVVFNQITRQAILEAMRHPRRIDPDLVDAYLARRALDYLVGFSLSPMLWRKLPGARTAPDLRPRTRDRGVQGPGILDHRGRFLDRPGRPVFGASFGDRRQEAWQIRYSQRGLGPRHRGGIVGRPLFG